MENNEIKELLLDLKNGQNKLIKGQEVLSEGQDKLFNGQVALEKSVETIEKRLDLVETRLDTVENEQRDFRKELEKLGLTVARIEVEHGEKLDILLDVVTGHTAKFELYSKKTKKFEERLDKHDSKLYALNSVVRAY